MISLISVCFYNRKWQGAFWYHISLGTKRGSAEETKKTILRDSSFIFFDKCGVRWKLTKQYLPRNVSLVAFQGPKIAYHLDSNRLSSTSV